jgi:CubicO group peptidase (beta-lactamase class C family)
MKHLISAIVSLVVATPAIAQLTEVHTAQQARAHNACAVPALIMSGCTPRSEPRDGPVARVRVSFDQSGIIHRIEDGLADVSTGRRITADDPARVASISKMVVAIGVMRLVEDGLVELDRDVSGYLGWSLRHPAHPETPITLRLLLSHNSGLTDAAGYGGPFNAPIREKLADAAVWDAVHGPGEYFRYANINYPVIATIMEAVTGERFDQLMDRLVIAPLSLQACFNWASCSDETAARAVVLYDRDRQILADDNRVRRPDCPVTPDTSGGCDLLLLKPGVNGGAFSPQGGLRISANDLAVIGRLLLGGGEINGVRLLSPASVDLILDPVWTFDGSNGETFDSETADPGGALFCRYGLGAQTLATRSRLCSDNPFADDIERVGHPGEAYGLVSGLWLDRATGTGVAYFITGADLTEYGTASAFYADEERLLAAPAEIPRTRNP